MAVVVVEGTRGGEGEGWEDEQGHAEVNCLRNSSSGERADELSERCDREDLAEGAVGAAGAGLDVQRGGQREHRTDPDAGEGHADDGEGDVGGRQEDGQPDQRRAERRDQQSLSANTAREAAGQPPANQT
jgi:hypothetical protein